MKRGEKGEGRGKREVCKKGKRKRKKRRDEGEKREMEEVKVKMIKKEYY